MKFEVPGDSIRECVMLVLCYEVKHGSARERLPYHVKDWRSWELSTIPDVPPSQLPKPQAWEDQFCGTIHLLGRSIFGLRKVPFAFPYC
jgi:hypothetical protein